MAYYLGWLLAVPPFSTTFDSTENPVSQGGIFTHGVQQVGTSSDGPVSTGGSPGSSYAPAADALDYIATVQGRYRSNKHYSEVTIRRVGGYAPSNTHEIEVHVGTTMGPSSAVGYEVDLAFGGAGVQCIRWEDPPGNYNAIVVDTLSNTWPGNLDDGDVVRAEFDSTSGSPVITVKVNGVTKLVFTDVSAGKIMNGNPGYAFFVRTPGTPSSFCIKGFACGSLP